MSEKLVNFKYADTLEGKTIGDDDFVVVNKGFAEGAEEGDKVFGSSYKGNMIVGTTEADKLRVVEDITVAGGAIEAAGVFTNNVIPAGMSVEEILRKLLCVEKWPTTTSTKGTCSASVGNPTISADITKNSVVEYGSTITFNAITAKTASLSKTDSTVTGFTHGYGVAATGDAFTSTSVSAAWASDSVGSSTLTATVSGFSSLATATGSTLPKQSVTADAVGTNTLTVKTTTGKCSASLPSVPAYYIVSNMGNRDEEHKSEAIDAGSFEVASVTNSVSFSVTAVYPVFNNVNADSLQAAVDKKMSLANTSVFEVAYPTEVGVAHYASFAYPANRTLTVKILNTLSGNFEDYAGTATDVAETNKRSINGKDVQYNVWTRTGENKSGANTYQFTLSKSTSVA